VLRLRAVQVGPTSLGPIMAHDVQRHEVPLVAYCVEKLVQKLA
jgi:hypothetical protein